MPLEPEALNAADHFARRFAGGIEAEVHQQDERVQRREQTAILSWTTPPFPGGKLAGQKLRSPAFGCDTGTLGCDGIGGCIGEIPHDLPTDGRIGIE